MLFLVVAVVNYFRLWEIEQGAQPAATPPLPPPAAPGPPSSGRSPHLLSDRI